MGEGVRVRERGDEGRNGIQGQINKIINTKGNKRMM